MIIQPRIRGFICTTAHPVGCAMNVHQQVDYVKKNGPIAGPAKRVLVLGCSTGYGLASRIVSAFACGADTIGVSFEKEPSENKTATAGWYNNRAFENEAKAAGRKAITIDADAFSFETKANVIAAIKEHLGQVDLVVYSMAAPVRTDPKTGVTYRSAIKPLGGKAKIKNLNTDKGEVFDAEMEPATPEETAATVKVMGGEDWELWIDALAEAGALAPDFLTLDYTYLGSEMTWPIYWKATLGEAKKDVDRAAAAIRAKHGKDSARVVALKAVVTQASAAIPLVTLYGAVLIKVMNEMGLGEGCIGQIDRMFRTRLWRPDAPLDEDMRLRMDDWELSDKVQTEMRRRWPLLTTETLPDLGDLPGFRAEFLKLFGFGLAGVDYGADVDPRIVPGIA
ncbi:MAG TPA: enoyl-ACP reductase FabV [Caulobacterales bacterium]|jgi:enoyl-[acyl-carrier protein] reductase/trans-2-enoyl-CoA reductase (NAD+)|nr:enoyl-ACP reductase FabV [Caulobacterales bacterium]